MSTVGSKSVCRSRGRKFDPGPYFCGDQEIISMVSPPSADSRGVVVSYKRNYVSP